MVAVRALIPLPTVSAQSPRPGSPAVEQTGASLAQATEEAKAALREWKQGLAELYSRRGSDQFEDPAPLDPFEKTRVRQLLCATRELIRPSPREMALAQSLERLKAAQAKLVAEMQLAKRQAGDQAAAWNGVPDRLAYARKVRAAWDEAQAAFDGLADESRHEAEFETAPGSVLGVLNHHVREWFDTDLTSWTTDEDAPAPTTPTPPLPPPPAQAPAPRPGLVPRYPGYVGALLLAIGLTFGVPTGAVAQKHPVVHATPKYQPADIGDRDVPMPPLAATRAEQLNQWENALAAVGGGQAADAFRSAVKRFDKKTGPLGKQLLPGAPAEMQDALDRALRFAAPSIGSALSAEETAFRSAADALYEDFTRLLGWMKATLTVSIDDAGDRTLNQREKELRRRTKKLLDEWRDLLSRMPYDPAAKGPRKIFEGRGMVAHFFASWHEASAFCVYPTGPTTYGAIVLHWQWKDGEWALLHPVDTQRSRLKVKLRFGGIDGEVSDITVGDSHCPKQRTPFGGAKTDTRSEPARPNPDPPMASRQARKAA